VMPAPRPNSAPAEPGLTDSARRRRAVFQSRADALASYRGRGAFRTWPDSMLRDYVEAGFQDLHDGAVSLACSPAWEASGYFAQEHDAWEALSRSLCPVDIVRGETGSTFQLSGGLEKLGDRVRVAIVPGTSHFLPMERPDIVRMALTDAIEGPVPAGVRTSVPA
jgi:pimeloyl-ACP methyl ester carboxylesterase